MCVKHILHTNHKDQKVTMPNPAVVLLSGGQDSTTCLVWAKKRFSDIYTLAFDYGQRHRIELDAAADIAKRAGVKQHRVLPVVSLAALGGDALTGDAPVPTALTEGTSLPATFVPGRNLLFLTLAAAWAWRLGVSDLVTGVCQTDSSGYPDCREGTMRAMQQALTLGLDTPMRIHTPLMFLTKAQSVSLAREIGALDLLAYSHTCYQGLVPPCGTCPACLLRARGFAEAHIPDPLLTRLGKA